MPAAQYRAGEPPPTPPQPLTAKARLFQLSHTLSKNAASIAEAIAFIQQRIPHPPRSVRLREALGLAPMQRLLRALGNPEVGLKVLHITGSKGKSSTARCAEHIAAALGARSGMFTSPHLHHWTERIRIAGKPLSDAYFGALIARIRPLVNALALDDAQAAPTFFEILTAAALLAFREQGVNCAIIEVGIGGRLDATNAVAAEVCCITSIEREHTERLGKTLALIAGEKAGIIKPGATAVISARLAPPAAQVIKARALSAAVPLLCLGRHITVRALRGRYRNGAHVTYANQTFTLPLPIPTRCHASNAAIALAGVFRLLAPPAKMRQPALSGLASLSLPGCLEHFGNAPRVVVDGAHTHASMQNLLASLNPPPGTRLISVIALTDNKHPAFLKPLIVRSQHLIATEADATRSLAARRLAERIGQLCPSARVVAEPDPNAAIALALRHATNDTLICITGSIYLAAIARAKWREAGTPV